MVGRRPPGLAVGDGGDDGDGGGEEGVGAPLGAVAATADDVGDSGAPSVPTPRQSHSCRHGLGSVDCRT